MGEPRFEGLDECDMFEGKVTEVDESSMRVQTAALQARVPVNPLRQFAVGDDIAFVVPEDRIRILTDWDAPAENTVSASVMGEEFIGAALRLYADAGSKQDIRLLTSYDTRSSGLAADHRLALSWTTSDAYVRPE